MRAGDRRQRPPLRVVGVLLLVLLRRSVTVDRVAVVGSAPRVVWPADGYAEELDELDPEIGQHPRCLLTDTGVRLKALHETFPFALAQEAAMQPLRLG